MESLKPDCSYALRRKRPQSLPAKLSRTLSPVRFESKSCGIAPISCNSQSNPGGFLCTSDCVAEGEEFEFSVQLIASKGATFLSFPRGRSRKLYSSVISHSGAVNTEDCGGGGKSRALDSLSP